MEFVSDTVGGDTVRVVPKKLDRHGRTIGDVFIRDVWLNRELVAHGLAKAETLARERVTEM